MYSYITKYPARASELAPAPNILFLCVRPLNVKTSANVIVRHFKCYNFLLQMYKAPLKVIPQM